jgi:aryl-alcohol dehydrogenase-like predicted oxidoreductase
MIPAVQLARSQLKTSRLAFGTSRLHHVDARHRRTLLATAAELGFVHFDTAPSYGDGFAESELGRFIRGRRSRFIIATKYGIPPDPIIAAVPSLSFAMRGARAIARKIGFQRSAPPPLTASGLRGSLEQSLRRLGTEWVDILFLHEPSPQRIPAADPLLEELISLRRKGLIRHFGLAGAWNGITAVGGSASGFGEIVQTAESEWPEEQPPDITYGTISMGPQSAFAVRVDPATALERLRAALARRPQGVVIVSTSKTEHLRRFGEMTATEPQ